MILEEALSKMRKGKKIRISYMPEDEYYQACRVSIHPDISKPINIIEMPMSIVWMKGERQHPDMMHRWNPYDPETDPCKHGMLPMINLLWLMSDEWEIVEINKP